MQRAKRITPIKNLSLLTLSLLLLMACATPRPDLKRLYDVSSSDHEQNPVILIPGAFGTKLRTVGDGKVIWPGNLADIFFSDYRSIAVNIDPQTLEADHTTTEAFALFDRALGVDFYGRILRVLEWAGGYTAGEPGTPVLSNSPRYYVFVYDWRQDLVKSAAELDRFIEQIRKDYRRSDLQVDIIAYSLGAPLARYYVRYGGNDVLDQTSFRPNYRGAAKIRKVVLFGAPNLGSVSALQNFMKGYKIPIGFGTIPVEVLATMPSAYQLLPHPDRDWMITPEGRKFTRDLYSADIWREYQWSIFDPVVRERISRWFVDETEAQRYLRTLEKFFEKQLRRGRNFHRALSVPLERLTVRYVVFGGDCELTPARCLIEQVDGKTVVKLRPEKIVNRIPGVDYHRLMLEPGDGRVTKPSLLARNALDPSVPGMDSDTFPLAYSVFLCVEHSQLTGDVSFQDNLLNVLLLQETTEDRMNKRPR